MRALESDVWLTADGVPVLDHDGVGPDERKLAELQRAELPGHIPALAELYQRCGTDFELSLDILDPAAAVPAVEVAAAAGASRRLWLCGEWPGPRDWPARDPEVHLVANLPWHQLGPRFAPLLREMRAAGICAVNLPFWLWTPRGVRLTHAAGLLAFGWRANRPVELAWLRRCGCDAIYSDSLDGLLALTSR